MKNVSVPGSNIPVVKRGVVVYDSEPYYYIEEAIIGRDAMILAYNLDKKSIKRYRVSHDYNDLAKANRFVKKTRETIDTRYITPLSKYVRSKLGNKGKQTFNRFEYQLPLFVTNLSTGVDTITQQYGRGFKEKVSGSYVGTLVKNGRQVQQVFPKMVDTGVFIGFSHIKWLDAAITPQGLLDLIKDIHDAYANSLSFSTPYEAVNPHGYAVKDPAPSDPKEVVNEGE